MSVNIVNQTTGELTRVAGNATDKVGNLNAATTTNKSSVVAMVNEINSALAGKADASSLADYATLDNSGHFPDANLVTKELVYINGFQSDLTNYPSEVSNTVGILLTRWFYYSGDLTVARMQLVFTLGGASFCRFFGGTSWTPWQPTSVGILSNLTTTDKSNIVSAINELNTVATTSITALSVPGITLTWLDNMPESHKAIRVGNLVIVNVGLDIDGVFTGTTEWIPVYDLPSSLLRSGESFITPYFTSMMCTNRRDNTVYGALIDGRRVWLDSTVDEYHLRISGQMILPILKS